MELLLPAASAVLARRPPGEVGAAVGDLPLPQPERGTPGVRAVAEAAPVQHVHSPHILGIIPEMYI